MKEENGVKSHRRSGRHREVDNQFVKRWMVTLACGCACVILSMSLMVSVWRNRQLTQQAQFSVEAQRFFMQRGDGVRRNVLDRGFSNFQERHHHLIRHGARYPAVVKFGENKGDINDSDGEDARDSDVTPSDASSKEQNDNKSSNKVNDEKSKLKHGNFDQPHQDSQESIDELKEKIRKLRDVYNTKVTKHRQRRAAGEPIPHDDEAALMAELKQMRFDYYKMVDRVKQLRGDSNQPEVSKQHDRSERHRQAQRIQEEKNASKQLRDHFLKGEHGKVREAAVGDYYSRADEIR